MGNYRRFAGCIWDVCARGANTSRNWLVILAKSGFFLLLCLCSSFPRRRESSSCFALGRHSGESRNPVSLLLICLRAHPFVFPLASVRAGHFSLLAQRKVTKRNAPREPRPPRYARRVRKVRPGFARWASCPFANSRASLRATLPGDSGLTSPRLTGPSIQSNSKSKSCFASAFRFSLLRAGRARSAPPGAPWPCGGSGRKGPQGAREGSRAFRCCTGCAISGTRPMTRTRRARCASGARRWGVFLWFLSLHEQRKEPARLQGEWKPLLLKKNKKQRHWIPAFAGMTSQSKSWIPAFAGMTSERAKTLDSSFRRNGEQKKPSARIAPYISRRHSPKMRIAACKSAPGKSANPSNNPARGDDLRKYGAIR